MKLLFAADMSFNYIDIIPSETEIAEQMREPAELFAAFDVSVVNLENVFGEKTAHLPIVKDGPNLISSPSFVSYLRALSPSVVGIANNHTMDYGEAPMYETRQILEREGFVCIGAGANIEESYLPAVFEKNGERVSVFAVCENEFGGADEDRAGTAGFRIGLLSKKMSEARAEGACPIVYFHTGHEGYPFPSPRRQETCRLLVDLGAAAVICMHAHCPQGYEVYRDAPIVYGMGNFYFPHFPNVTPAWYHGYMSELELCGGKATLKIHPYRFDSAIHLLKGEERAAFDSYMEYINAPISSYKALRELFDAWCMVPTRFGYYEELASFSMDLIEDGHRDRTPKMKNIFGCEAHNELLTNLAEMIFEERIERARKGVAQIEALQRMEIPKSL